MPVLYGDIYRQRRGHCVVRFEFIAQPPYQSLPEGGINERYKNKLEESIRQHPSD